MRTGLCIGIRTHAGVRGFIPSKKRNTSKSELNCFSTETDSTTKSMCVNLSDLLALIICISTTAVNDTSTHWSAGRVVHCKGLKRHKKESFTWLNPRVEVMNESYAVVMNVSEIINTRGQIKVSWLGNSDICLAIKPRHLRAVSDFVIHFVSDRLQVKSVWSKLSSDPMNNIFIWPPNMGCWTGIQANSSTLQFLPCFSLRNISEITLDRKENLRMFIRQVLLSTSEVVIEVMFLCTKSTNLHRIHERHEALRAAHNRLRALYEFQPCVLAFHIGISCTIPARFSRCVAALRRCDVSV